MLTILEAIKDEAGNMRRRLRAGVHVIEADLIWFADKAEEAIGMHKAATEEPSSPAPELPAGYPPITPS